MRTAICHWLVIPCFWWWRYSVPFDFLALAGVIVLRSSTFIGKVPPLVSKKRVPIIYKLSVFLDLKLTIRNIALCQLMGLMANKGKEGKVYRPYAISWGMGPCFMASWGSLETHFSLWEFLTAGSVPFNEPKNVYVFRPNTAISWDDRRVGMDKEQLLGDDLPSVALALIPLPGICFFKDTDSNRRELGSRSALSDLPPPKNTDMAKRDSGYPSVRPTRDVPRRSGKGTLWSFPEIGRQDGTYVRLSRWWFSESG